MKISRKGAKTQRRKAATRVLSKSKNHPFYPVHPVNFTLSIHDLRSTIDALPHGRTYDTARWRLSEKTAFSFWVSLIRRLGNS
jgi:hypothetical protein